MTFSVGHEPGAPRGNRHTRVCAHAHNNGSRYPKERERTRERDGERETDRQTDRETDKQTDRHRERESLAHIHTAPDAQPSAPESGSGRPHLVKPCPRKGRHSKRVAQQNLVDHLLLAVLQRAPHHRRELLQPLGLGDDQDVPVLQLRGLGGLRPQQPIDERGADLFVKEVHRLVEAEMCRQIRHGPAQLLVVMPEVLQLPGGLGLSTRGIFGIGVRRPAPGRRALYVLLHEEQQPVQRHRPPGPPLHEDPAVHRPERVVGLLPIVYAHRPVVAPMRTPQVHLVPREAQQEACHVPQPRGRQIGGGLELEAAGRVQGPEVIDGPLLRVVLLQRLVGEDLPRAEGGGVGAGEEVPRSEPLREAVADDGDAAEVDELLVGKEARRARVLQERARVEQPPVEGLADGGEGLGGDGVRGLALGPRGGGEDALHLAEGEEVVVEEEREELDPEGAEDFDGDALELQQVDDLQGGLRAELALFQESVQDLQDLEGGGGVALALAQGFQTELGVLRQ
mmetsp:Transcript_54980/g.90652  ORF Transcript_54980/g.90652 Transcript_54980/m.90652 type:complete len:510 (-) Transcript_54980:435-1964(-)